MMPRRLACLMLTLALMICALPAVAQDADSCTRALEARRADLRAIVADLNRDGLTDQTIQRLIAWRDQFHIDAVENDLMGHLGGAGIGTISGVAGGVLAGGPVAWGSAIAGAVIGEALWGAVELISMVGAWSAVDDNSAFHQYLIDYVEYGRVPGEFDHNLIDFIEQHRPALARLSGAPVPADGPRLHLWLQANAETLLLFFGMFEERLGPQAFPRWKFPAGPGRYGPNRLGTGYYRRLLAGRMSEQLAALEHEIAGLAAACAGQEVAVPQIPSCPRGLNAESLVCLCDRTSFDAVWGTDLYTDDSDICAAAVHAGLLRPSYLDGGTRGYRGIVSVVRTGGCPQYWGSRAYGIDTRPYHGWPGSFYFPAVQSGHCEASTPPPGAWYCPEFADRDDLTCYCGPRDIEAGGERVWGTTFYTDDSRLCSAARHAGAVSARGGMIRAIRMGGRDRYEGSVSNGIESRDYRDWPRSIAFP
ncbi:MAG: hypothetical protein KDK12_02560 [Rhodobacteraceae bacterium]|nr:hypothetical protein [Paracoccaceae bacterium]